MLRPNVCGVVACRHESIGRYWGWFIAILIPLALLYLLLFVQWSELAKGYELMLLVSCLVIGPLLLWLGYALYKIVAKR